MAKRKIKDATNSGDLEKLIATIRVFDEFSNATTLRLWIEDDENFRVQILDDELIPKQQSSFTSTRHDLLRLGQWFTSTARLV